jgi:hypothetical protein
MRTTDAAVVLGAATGGQSRPGLLRVGSDERYLIVNADDFGLSPGVNRGVITTSADPYSLHTSSFLLLSLPVSPAS